ncbi:MAG: hypothetical protein ACOX69_11740 [Coriobacteriales bacterium]|jgi:cytosine permease
MNAGNKQNGKAAFKVKAPARDRAPSGSNKKSVMAQASLFERVPENMRLAWPDIASILSGVVSSLSKLMGGGIVAFYAGCQLGGLAVAITFALSFVLTYLVGRVTFEEGLPNNVASRIYIFGTKGSAVGSLAWIFLIVGVLAVGTVQLGNAIMFAFGITDQTVKTLLFLGISCVWICMALFGAKFIARMNAVFVVALFCVMGYVIYLIAANGQLVDAATHGVMVPGVEPLQGFSYGVNYAVMTSGLLALFAADFTRFARKSRDLVPISLVGSLFAILTYIFGALITYYGFDAAYQYFMASGSYDATGAANAAITNPGISLVLASGGIGLAIICLSQMKVETSNSIGGANAVSNIFDSLFGVKLPWPVAVIIANAIGLVFIFGNILDKVNAFMSIGSILTIGWCVLLITDYYVVRGPMHIGLRHMPLDKIEAVNWRGVVTLIIVTAVNSWLYAAGIVSVPILVVAPMTFVIYIILSLIFKDKVRASDAKRMAESQTGQAAGEAEKSA